MRVTLHYGTVAVLASALIALLSPLLARSDNQTSAAPLGTAASKEQVRRGQALWNMHRGRNEVSLERCDLGEGRGNLHGAFAKLPRYFSDTDRVMDLEQRLLWCMETLQGVDLRPLIERPFPGATAISEVEDLVAYVSSQSNGMRIQPQTSHPKEQEALAAGTAMFFRRSGTLDRSCATCHAGERKRVLRFNVPKLDVPGPAAQAVLSGWPAYMVGQQRVRTLQYQIWECYRDMRMPEPTYASEGITAISLFLANNAAGATIQVPSTKN